MEHNRPHLVICFDESGKQSRDPIQLMGAISIPENIYRHSKFTDLHKLNEVYNLHWKEYGGDGKNRNGIEKLFQYALPLAEYMQLNFIRYSRSLLAERANIFLDLGGPKKEIVDDTIYAKLPERICYGLLRGYGEHNYIQATILIEDASEYRSRKLEQIIKNSLNSHSLYRGEDFIIRECGYRSKGQEVGIELTDILLGIVGVILDNPTVESRKKKEKVDLILKLLKEHKLQPFLENLRLFELQQSDQLKEANIEASVKLFISKNYERFITL